MPADPSTTRYPGEEQQEQAVIKDHSSNFTFFSAEKHYPKSKYSNVHTLKVKKIIRRMFYPLVPCHTMHSETIQTP